MVNLCFITVPAIASYYQH